MAINILEFLAIHVHHQVDYNIVECCLASTKHLNLVFQLDDNYLGHPIRMPAIYHPQSNINMKFMKTYIMQKKVLLDRSLSYYSDMHCCMGTGLKDKRALDQVWYYNPTGTFKKPKLTF